jgi:hypothetical protein
MSALSNWNLTGIFGRIVILIVLLFVLVIQPNTIAKSQSPVSDKEFKLIAEIHHYKKLAKEAIRRDMLMNAGSNDSDKQQDMGNIDQ